MANEQRITSFHRAGLSFDVVDSGPLDGDPVVLLHGFPQRATSWARVARVLNEAGLRTFAPDQRGYAPGARPRRVRAYRARELAADVAALVDEIGGPVHLVGHDWGAAVAWGTVLQHPAAVRSLTAVSVGHPSAFLRSLRTPEQLRRSGYMLVFQVPLLAERLLRGGPGEWFLRQSGMDDAMYARFRGEIVDDGALTGGLGWYRALPLSVTEPRGPVDVPTTMVWSDRDEALGRRQAERTADHVTGPFELVVLEGVSHWIPEERPEELAAAIVRRARSVTR